MNKTMLVILIVIIISITMFFTLRKQTTTVTTNTTTNNKTFTLEEVAKHATKEDCWIAIDSSVIDATSFIASGKHNPEILRGCGHDATTMFTSERKHTKGEAQSLLQELRIGTLSK
ncbi:MAG: cytochrome b5 domain-containing protein [Candidatus Pacebacteria bacterium]|nr:cytochrome b5 domain-containing protein [Candidatus Paceibacterota bacterium]MBP9866718.1 cytochrome b5 domain-containing protein [Candidatus Paceibacterota bacterium]